MFSIKTGQIVVEQMKHIVTIDNGKTKIVYILVSEYYEVNRL